MRKLRWEINPKIGFWIENDPIRFYYGTSLAQLGVIAKAGIMASSDGWVSLYLEPYSAWSSEVVVVIELPARWMMQRMDQRLRGNSETDKTRLLEKNSYIKWSKMDYEYYAGLRVHIANLIPSLYIVGYTKKD